MFSFVSSSSSASSLGARSTNGGSSGGATADAAGAVAGGSALSAVRRRATGRAGESDTAICAAVYTTTTRSHLMRGTRECAIARGRQQVGDDKQEEPT